jgi:hypothetical protein
MKPAWDALMVEYKDSKSVLVADVDCTADGKPLCEKAGVKGYPTIKHGDPDNMEDYKGGRDEKALNAFVKTLKPSCSPANIDLCDAEQKKEITKVQGLSDKELDTAIAEKEKQLVDSEAFFKSEVEKLQKNYEKLQSDKEATATEVKESGLGMMKAVKATKASGKAEL